MLDTHKLIYILPEVAYVAEMLPGKKQHTFTIQNFRQINGEYIKNEKFVVENILKLCSKVDPDKYHLILPDSLFTNTIVSTTETGDAKIKKYISETLLPSLDITQDTHHVESFVLTEFKGVAKLQICALEKELVAPLRAAASQYDIKINGVSPLSWTVKSLVSLEPSVTVLQIGSQVYTALQYIGVDQATISPVADLDIVSETIKTLKGSEPSIQTIYLLGNNVVEKSLKDTLKSILPIQQLSDFSEDETKMPSYVKQIIEAGMKTLEISDYPVPKFELGKATEEEMSLYVAGNLEAVEKSKDEEDDTEEVSAALPAPTTAAAVLTPPVAPIALEAETETVEPVVEGESEVEKEPEDKDAVVEEPTEPAEGEEPATSEVTLETEKEDSEASETSNETETPATEAIVAPVIEPMSVSPTPIAVTDTTVKEEMPTEKEEPTNDTSADSSATEMSASPENVDISQFAQPVTTVQPAPSMPQTTPSQSVIKNKSGVGNMVKMLLITLVVFAITVAIGVGVGLSILSLTNKNSAEDANQVESPAPTESAAPSPTPEASASAQVNRKELSILIVNATGKAGYAGGFKSKLDALDYKSVTTGNAKSDYETGNYVLMKERNDAIISALSQDTGLDLEYQATGYDSEDANGTNNAVVVLSE